MPGSGRPWRRIWQLIPIFLPGNPMGRGAWQTTVHGVAKSQTWMSIWAAPVLCHQAAKFAATCYTAIENKCSAFARLWKNLESRKQGGPLPTFRFEPPQAAVWDQEAAGNYVTLKLRPGCERDQPAAPLGPPADDHIQCPPPLLTEEEGPLLSPTSQIYSQRNVTVKHVISRSLAERKSGIRSSQASSTWPETGTYRQGVRQC